jgi:hypothetical protein
MRNWFKHSLESTRFRIVASLAILSMLLLTSGAVAHTLRARAQSRVQRNPLVERIEKSPTIPLRIQQDDGTPLRILEANVREISPADYEKLTSEKSDLPSIISAPEVKMVNVSSKTINRIMLRIDDVSAQKSTGVMMHDLSVGPGATFTIVPANFVKPENVTTVDESGTVASSLKDPMTSKKFWLPFADKSQLQVRVGVEFQDGTTWFNRDQTVRTNDKTQERAN